MYIWIIIFNVWIKLNLLEYNIYFDVYKKKNDNYLIEYYSCY